MDQIVDLKAMDMVFLVYGSNGSKRGTQFYGGSEAHGLELRSKGDEQGVFGLGLQMIKERDTISWW